MPSLSLPTDPPPPTPPPTSPRTRRDWTFPGSAEKKKSQQQGYGLWAGAAIAVAGCAEAAPTHRRQTHLSLGTFSFLFDFFLGPVCCHPGDDTHLAPRAPPRPAAGAEHPSARRPPFSTMREKSRSGCRNTALTALTASLACIDLCEHLEHFAVINLTSRRELRSAPSGPDDRYRVAGKRALAPGRGGARSQGKGRKVNTGLRGLVCALGFP